MMSKQRRLAGCLALAVLGFGSSAFAFECPKPQPTSAYGLNESKQEQQQLSQLLASGDMENRLGDVVADLRKKYPQVPRFEIVNYLVGAYCPAVKAMPNISDEAKTQKVEQFSETVFDLVAKQQL